MPTYSLSKLCLIVWLYQHLVLFPETLHVNLTCTITQLTPSSGDYKQRVKRSGMQISSWSRMTTYCPHSTKFCFLPFGRQGLLLVWLLLVWPLKLCVKGAIIILSDTTINVDLSQLFSSIDLSNSHNKQQVTPQWNSAGVKSEKSHGLK